MAARPCVDRSIQEARLLMSTTISEILIAEGRQPVEFEGRLVYGRWPLEVEEGEKLILQLQFNRIDLRQAVSLKISEGTVEVDGTTGKYIILWCDEAPPRVEVVC